MNQEHIDLWICGFVTNNEDEPIDMDMVYKTIDDTLCEKCGRRSRSASPSKRRTVCSSPTPIVSPTTQVVPDSIPDLAQTDTMIINDQDTEFDGGGPKTFKKPALISQPDSGIGMDEGICDIDSDGGEEVDAVDDLRSPILLKASCDNGQKSPGFCSCDGAMCEKASFAQWTSLDTPSCLHCSVQLNTDGETGHACCVCTCKHMNSYPTQAKSEDGSERRYCLHCSVIENGDGKGMRRCMTCDTFDQGTVTSKQDTEVAAMTQEPTCDKKEIQCDPVVDSGSDLRPPPLPPEAVKGQPAGQRQGKEAAVVGVKVSGQDKGLSGVRSAVPPTFQAFFLNRLCCCCCTFTPSIASSFQCCHMTKHLQLLSLFKPDLSKKTPQWT